MADWIAAGVDPERAVVLRPVDGAGARRAALAAVDDHAARLARAGADLQGAAARDREPRPQHLRLPRLSGAADGRHHSLPRPLVPVGEDQASHLEISREIARRFNALYGPVFPEPQALHTPTAKVPGIDGRKMSKSYGNAINLSDPPETFARSACRCSPTRRGMRRKDPGHPETCNLFAFHQLLSPPDLQERVARECRAAEIGCVDDKATARRPDHRLPGTAAAPPRGGPARPLEPCSSCCATARGGRASAPRETLALVRWRSASTTTATSPAVAREPGAAGRPAAAGIVARSVAGLRGAARPAAAPGQAQRGAEITDIPMATSATSSTSTWR
jgi:hypothetical protein